MEPTAKTFYSFGDESFIIADLKPTREELLRWAQLDPDANGRRSEQ